MEFLSENPNGNFWFESKHLIGSVVQEQEGLYRMDWSLNETFAKRIGLSPRQYLLV